MIDDRWSNLQKNYSIVKFSISDHQYFFDCLLSECIDELTDLLYGGQMLEISVYYKIFKS